MVTSTPVAFANRQAPAFNKTLADYLRDKDLNRLVSQQIIQMNTPLVAANKQENVNRGRKVNTNKQLGDSLQASYAKALADQAVSNAADIARNTNRANLLKQQTADAEAQVPITYLEGEASKAKAEAGSAIANEQSMSDQLVNRLASQGQQYLEQLKNAEASQTRVNEQSINNAADDVIRANVAQVRANQAQRGSLLGTLASDQYKNAIDLYNTGVGNFNEAENRRFQAAVKNSENKLSAAQAQAQVDVELMKGSQPSGEVSPERKRYNKLNDQISAYKSKMVKNPKDTNKKVKATSTKEGKAELAAMRKERDRIGAKYGYS
jgi:hypothetical protein